MIGLDTNVLVRYLARDDVKPAAPAMRLIEKELTACRQGFISLVVLSELCWVLSSIDSATSEELIAAVQDLLNKP